MENNSCGYCGYKGETASEPVMSAAQQGQTAAQPQIIINNQAAPGLGMMQGVSRKSKTVALLLCIFLGGLGVHRFYVGKIGTGIIYLFTVGLLGIGWIIDIIMIAVGSFRDQYDLPLRH